MVPREPSVQIFSLTSAERLVIVNAISGVRTATAEQPALKNIRHSAEHLVVSGLRWLCHMLFAKENSCTRAVLLTEIPHVSSL